MAFETRETKNISRASPNIARVLLRWYDANARALPWRVGPKARKAGAIPDPYRVWLSEIMLQQTTVATVTPRYLAFLKRWPNVNALAAAPLDDVLGEWAGLGYYARARNLHKCAVVIATEYGGKFPDTEEALKKLPGIGDYTAAAIAAIACDRVAIVVDGNIERIVARLYAVDKHLPAAKPLIKNYAQKFWPQKRSGDFAQGLMDLGALICRPKTPRCFECPIAVGCTAYQNGGPENYPKKVAKKAKPQRKGAVFLMQNARGEILFERRPDKGLLGGMLGLPGTPWANEKPENLKSYAPAKSRWRRIGEIEHVFTHFHLTLEVFVGAAPKGFRRDARQQWVAPGKARAPTVMKKALDLYLASKKSKIKGVA